MISNVVIVHGCPTNIEKAMNPATRDYDKHWIQWIKKELEKQGIPVETPLMPNPWDVDYTEWKHAFEKNKITKNSILVGHSCGCAFLVRWLGDTKKSIQKLILVAPWKIPYGKGEDFEKKKKFYDFKIDESIQTRVKEMVIFTSNNEAVDGKKSVQLYHRALGGKLIDLPNKGHYTQRDMGTTEFPELLNEIVS